MTKQEILHIYGKSVYAIRLETATGMFLQTGREASGCLKIADEFIAALQAEDAEELQNKFP